MSAATVRKLAILEPLSVFALIVCYIWSLRFRHPAAWLAILGLILVSHLTHRDRAVAMGFQRHNLKECLERFAPLLAFVALSLFAAGLLLQTLRPVGWNQAVGAGLAYLPWGTFQQYMLNGYFLNRLQIALPQRTACALAAALFSGAHAPNWFLMAITLVAGYGATRIFQRYQNLYFLGIAHATLGFLLFLVVPDSISHHLDVGPGWFAFHAR